MTCSSQIFQAISIASVEEERQLKNPVRVAIQVRLMSLRETLRRMGRRVIRNSSCEILWDRILKKMQKEFVPR